MICDMSRASSIERAHRINAALGLIRAEGSIAGAARVLSRQYGLSRSQAYRYLWEAKREGKEVRVPDAKMAFTVKLSEELINEVRRGAQARGESISEFVSRALEAFVHRGREGGHKRGKSSTDRT